MTNNHQLADWLVGTIEAEYAGDICILLEHQTLKLENDRQIHCPSFFIPATNRAMALARTFIIDGVGYDIFPMGWERIERMADVGDYNTTCLADATVLYARTEEDRVRFESLRARLMANLNNPKLMRERAKDWLGTATEIYQDSILFSEDESELREAAGHVCDMLSIAVAFMNGQYFVHGQTDQIARLREMARVPGGFIDLYETVVRADDPQMLKRLCRDMILLVKAFVEPAPVNAPAAEADYAELAAWYQELIYTFRRVYHFIDANAPVNAYLWGCGLQHAVAEVAKTYALEDTDVMGAWRADDLAGFRARVEAVERHIVGAIEAHGARIERYETIDAFLAGNP